MLITHALVIFTSSFAGVYNLARFFFLVLPLQEVEKEEEEEAVTFAVTLIT